MIIGRQFTFDAAHWLPNHPGLCKNLHGHTWTLWVEIEGPIDPQTGMVADFSKLKIVVNSLLNKLDHQCLNNQLGDLIPTCENLSSWIAKTLALNIPEPITKIFITLQEGKGGYAKYELQINGGQSEIPN